MKQQRNYDKKVKQTRILLADYLLLKELANIAGVSMSEALHQLITGQVPKTPVPAEQIRMPVDMAKSIPVIMAEVTPTIKAGLRVSPIVKLRATVAGRGSTNGRKQM